MYIYYMFVCLCIDIVSEGQPDSVTLCVTRLRVIMSVKEVTKR